MAFDVLLLSILALASIAGVARFPDRPRFDHVTAEGSRWLANFGAFLFIEHAIGSDHLWPLIPFSLLFFARACGWLYRNDFIELVCLPIVMVETLVFMQWETFDQFSQQGLLLTFMILGHGIGLRCLVLAIRQLQPKPALSGSRWSPYALAQALSRSPTHTQL